MKAIRIAVDAMGGDNAPDEIVKGAVAALENAKIQLMLVGKKASVEKSLEGLTYDSGRVKIIDATEVIETNETPTVAIRQKKDSSIVVGLNLVKNGEADSFVSAGNTGALLAGATVIIGRIKGVERPALATLLPNKSGFSFLIDSGANVDCKPVYLAQFAKMGHVYMENVMGIKSPRIGLVNVGAEKEKGNALTKEAYDLIADAGLNFTGNVEARDIPLGAVDVVVCDAFVGNVILKYSEGFAKGIMGMVKEELMTGFWSKIGAALSAGAYKNLKKRFDYSEVGGAPFLGLKALVVKAHGSSDAKAIKNAVGQCVSFVENDIVGKISERII